MSTITTAQANREITRRQRGDKSAKARAKAKADGTFGLTNDDLKALAGQVTKPAAPAKSTPAKVAQVKAEKVSDPAKADANRAFRIAFDHAEDGDKRRAAGTAYRLVLTGKATVADIEAACK